MNLTQFLLRESWKHIVIAAMTGSISGICSEALLTFINSALKRQDTSMLFRRDWLQVSEVNL
jgi:putative pyoverdin transport system ATP-binding/permease protein